MDLSDPYLRSLLLQRFARHNTAGRIDFLDAPKSLADHLALYSRIDIALDPSPYQGTTTTCEALWMGVPVLTQAGRTHAGRVGVSLLTNIGAPELIAKDDDDFVRRAVELANAPDRLATYRATLRAQMAASPLLDRVAFCRRMESAFRHMWHTYCAQ
jgi:predicted O-linked N-acetylglucosamine transferase (SPINDLY family)